LGLFSSVTEPGAVFVCPACLVKEYMLRFASLSALLAILFAIAGCAPVDLILVSAQATQANVFKEFKPTQPLSVSPILTATQHGSTNGGQTPMKSEQAILEFTENDSGQSISITTGTSITIRLNSQLSTGYSWILKEMNESVIAQEGEPQYTAFSKLAGGAETVVWKFRSVGVGSAALKLVYTRVFEKDKPPLKTFELTIKVDK
jgi:inhibitor of cysteine peptidase